MKRDVEEQQKTQNIIKNIFFIKKKPSELYQIKKSFVFAYEIILNVQKIHV